MEVWWVFRVGEKGLGLLGFWVYRGFATLDTTLLKPSPSCFKLQNLVRNIRRFWYLELRASIVSVLLEIWTAKSLHGAGVGLKHHMVLQLFKSSLKGYFKGPTADLGSTILKYNFSSAPHF